MDALVRGVVHEDGVERNFVEDGEHRVGRVVEEVGNDRLRVGEVEEGDFE